MTVGRKCQTDLTKGDRFQFTGLTGDTVPNTIMLTVMGISPTGDVQCLCEVFAPGNDRIGPPTTINTPLLTALEMIEQGIWRHQT